MFLEALNSKKSVERIDFKVFFQPKNIRFLHENKLVSCVRARVVYGFLHTNDDPGWYELRYLSTVAKIIQNNQSKNSLKLYKFAGGGILKKKCPLDN